MKKLILLTLILLLHSFPSFADPREKGIICEHPDTYKVKLDKNERMVKGFYFNSEYGKMENILFTMNTDVSLTRYQNEYKATTETIQWKNNYRVYYFPDNSSELRTDIYTLNRKTLKLTRWVNYIPNKVVKEETLSCKVIGTFQSGSEFTKWMKKQYKDKYRSVLDEILKKNKIQLS